MNFLTMFIVSSFIALGFSGWGIIGNFSGANAAWVGTVVMVGSAVIVPALSANELLSQSPPGLRSIVILIILAIANAVAVHVYAGKLNSLKLA